MCWQVALTLVHLQHKHQQRRRHQQLQQQQEQAGLVNDVERAGLMMQLVKQLADEADVAEGLGLMGGLMERGSAAGGGGGSAGSSSLMEFEEFVLLAQHLAGVSGL